MGHWPWSSEHPEFVTENQSSKSGMLMSMVYDPDVGVIWIKLAMNDPHAQQ